MLTHSVTVIVPGTLGPAGWCPPWRRRRVLRTVTRILTAAYGGATLTHGRGVWGGTHERVTLVQCFGATPQWAAVAEAAHVIQTALRQDAVGIIWDGTFLLYPQEAPASRPTPAGVPVVSA